jgi:hypothetical protein
LKRWPDAIIIAGTLASSHVGGSGFTNIAITVVTSKQMLGFLQSKIEDWDSKISQRSRGLAGANQELAALQVAV